MQFLHFFWNAAATTLLSEMLILKLAFRIQLYFHYNLKLMCDKLKFQTVRLTFSVFTLIMLKIQQIFTYIKHKILLKTSVWSVDCKLILNLSFFQISISLILASLKILLLLYIFGKLLKIFIHHEKYPLLLVSLLILVFPMTPVAILYLLYFLRWRYVTTKVHHTKHRPTLDWTITM